MKNLFPERAGILLSPILTRLSILIVPLTFLLPLKITAQIHIKTEAAICTINVNNKTYELKPNQVGYFQRVSNIEKLAVVPVEIYYPQGDEGEKVLLSVLDGGTLDSNKRATVAMLDSEKKCKFNFQVTDNLGLFRITLQKGNDSKVVQLWVGAETNPVKQ